MEPSKRNIAERLTNVEEYGPYLAITERCAVWQEKK